MLVPNQADAPAERREVDRLLLRARGRREARGVGQLHLPGRGRPRGDGEDRQDARRQPADLPQCGRPQGHVRTSWCSTTSRRRSTKESGRMSQVAEASTASKDGDADRFDGLRLRQPDQGVRRVHGRQVAGPRHPHRVVLRAAGSVGLRQDDDPPDGRRAWRRPPPGTIRLSGKDITWDKPYRRPVNTVFQNYALFPHLDIHENVAFGLRRRKTKEVDPKVREMLELVELGVAGTQEAGPALRRPAAARRPGPGADQQPRGAAARRAARCPRPEAAPLHADRDQADPDRGRPDLRARHPRPGGGHDDGRHHRGHEQGRGRADGRTG